MSFDAKAIARSCAKAALFFLALGSGVAVHNIYTAVWAAPEPFWAPREDEAMHLGCYMERLPDGGDVSVQFTGRGHKVVVTSRGEAAELTFQRGGMAGDRYRGNGAAFLYDGEGYISGLKSGDRGPCQ